MPAPSAWESAFESHYVGLCEYVLRLLGSAEAAQDVVQDLFLSLWERRSLGRGEGDAHHLTRPYLYVAARNRALAYLRHMRVAQGWIERASREQPATADTPEELCLRSELRTTVQHAIAALPPRCREVFLLRRRDQLGYQEIAARLGVSLGTVKSQMWRAAAALKRALTPYLTPVDPVVAAGPTGRFILPARSGVLTVEPSLPWVPTRDSGDRRNRPTAVP